MALSAAPGRKAGGLRSGLRFRASDVLIGSRDAGRAQEAADSVRQIAPSIAIDGALNAAVAAQSDTVVIAVPYAAQKPTLQSLTTRTEGQAHRQRGRAACVQQRRCARGCGGRRIGGA